MEFKNTRTPTKVNNFVEVKSNDNKFLFYRNNVAKNLKRARSIRNLSFTKTDELKPQPKFLQPNSNS